MLKKTGAYFIFAGLSIFSLIFIFDQAKTGFSLPFEKNSLTGFGFLFIALGIMLLFISKRQKKEFGA